MEFEIEKINDIRYKNNMAEYLVKWKGYENTENLWVKEHDMNADKIIKDFKDFMKKNANKFIAVRKTNNQIEYLLQLKNGSARNYDSATATKLWPDRLLSFLERNILWSADDSKNDEVRNISSGFISVSDAEQINVDKIEYVTNIAGALVFVVRLTGSTSVKMMPAPLAHKFCKELIIEFYEKYLKF